MKFETPLIEARFKARRKRFFADCELLDGTPVVAHCANTGSMVSCLQVDAPVLLTHHEDPKRKLAYSLQALRMPDGWVGLNTTLANRLADEAIRAGLVPGLERYGGLRREVAYGENSRADFLLSEGYDEQGQALPDCLVEVKNVTLLLAPGRAGFPDAVTTRGSKHLRELMKQKGRRAVLLYCVQRESAQSVEPATAFDPDYAREFRLAQAAGLEVVALRAVFEPDGIRLSDSIPVL